MARLIKVAAVQMEATPAATPERLRRAEALVAGAAQAGAHLVALPELFNLGYGYREENFERAERLSGPTATWMRETAARLGIHLAGSLLLLDGPDVFNSLLLFAPDGRFWRYDKNYPWGWERAYFRQGQGASIARTDLGDLGLMICWDTAHRELWRQYAGRVDLMVITSCPPQVSDPVYHFPNGERLTLDDFGTWLASMKRTGRRLFGEMINQQTAWLGVPAVNTTGTGQITTPIPRGRASLATMLPLAPWLAGYLPQADRLQLSCDFVQGCKIVDAQGQVLTELAQAQGESFTLAEVVLAERKPQPAAPQPPSTMPLPAYFSSDVLLPWLTTPVYRDGVRRAWGAHMAPPTPLSQRRLGLLALGAAVVLGAGLLLSRRRRRRS